MASDLQGQTVIPVTGGHGVTKPAEPHHLQKAETTNRMGDKAQPLEKALDFLLENIDNTFVPIEAEATDSILKDNIRILQHRPYFPTFLCQRDSWRQKYLKLVQYSVFSIRNIYNCFSGRTLA